jgi:hypothetical protein
VIVERVSAWIPVTQEMLDDAEGMRRALRNVMEYESSTAKDAPLTMAERLTGWRAFTDSTGYTAEYRVGWRLALHHALADFAREAWPEDYADDNDD